MYDIHLQSSISLAEAENLLSKVLQLDLDQCLVIADTEQIPNIPATNQAWALLVPRGGEFRTSLSIYAKLDQPVAEVEIARRLAAVLGSACLISDESDDPYSWQLVSQDGTVESVEVDSTAVDRDELVLVRP